MTSHGSESGNPSEATAERRARAAARRARGMSFEVFEGFPDEVEESDSTVGERIERMTRLVRAAWLVSGRELPNLPRNRWPGEIFVIEDRR